jgi:hypothetical protein
MPYALHRTHRDSRSQLSRKVSNLSDGASCAGRVHTAHVSMNQIGHTHSRYRRAYSTCSRSSITVSTDSCIWAYLCSIPMPCSPSCKPTPKARHSSNAINRRNVNLFIGSATTAVVGWTYEFVVRVCISVKSLGIFNARVSVFVHMHGYVCGSKHVASMHACMHACAV